MARETRENSIGVERTDGGSFAARVATVLALVLAFATVAALAVLGIGVLLSAFFGLLLAIALNAPSRFLARKTPLSYGWALLLVIVVVLALLAGAGWLLGAQVAEQAEAFGEMLPRFVADLEAWLEQYGWGQWVLQQARGSGEGGGDGAMGAGMGVLAWFSDLSSYVLVAVFVGLFAAANPRIYVDGTVALVPPRHRARTRELIAELGHTLRWWLIGQGVAMVLIGASVTILLMLFGVPLALVIGIIVGLLGFIPYIGPIIGLVPVALVAATVDGTTALYVIAAYTGVQLVEGYIIQPLIHERTVYLPPAFTVFFQILLGAVLGVIGIVMATPLAAVLLVLSRFYRRDVLGDRDAVEED